MLDETGLGEEERRSAPVLTRTSHAVFVSPLENECDRPEVSLRFFTATGELPARGHGTVAALAFLAESAGSRKYHATLHTPGRALTGGATRANGRFEAAFDAGPVAMGEPVSGKHDAALSALGVTADLIAPAVVLASPGRPRLLVPVATRPALAALAPDFDRLRIACDRLGPLGYNVYCEPTRDGRLTARTFAPSIGVPENIANPKQRHLPRRPPFRTACHHPHGGHGDPLRTPSTITTTAGRARPARLLSVWRSNDRSCSPPPVTLRPLAPNLHGLKLETATQYRIQSAGALQTGDVKMANHKRSVTKITHSRVYLVKS